MSRWINIVKTKPACQITENLLLYLLVDSLIYACAEPWLLDTDAYENYVFWSWKPTKQLEIFSLMDSTTLVLDNKHNIPINICHYNYATAIQVEVSLDSTFGNIINSQITRFHHIELNPDSLTDPTAVLSNGFYVRARELQGLNFNEWSTPVYFDGQGVANKPQIAQKSKEWLGVNLTINGKVVSYINHVAPGPVRIAFYNLSGRLLYSTKSFSQNKSIRVALPQHFGYGAYMIKIMDNNNRICYSKFLH
jgi:hypothetical protein